MRIKVKRADLERMRKRAEIPKHMQLKTPAHAKQYLLSSIHLAMKQPTKSAMKLLVSQQLIAERWEVKMITSMRKRRRLSATGSCNSKGRLSTVQIFTRLPRKLFALVYLLLLLLFLPNL